MSKGNYMNRRNLLACMAAFPFLGFLRTKTGLDVMRDWAASKGGKMIVQLEHPDGRQLLRYDDPTGIAVAAWFNKSVGPDEAKRSYVRDFVFAREEALKKYFPGRGLVLTERTRATCK